MQNDMVIMDSFPLPVCLSVRNYKVHTFGANANISYNPSKEMWFYGFEVTY